VDVTSDLTSTIWENGIEIQMNTTESGIFEISRCLLEVRRKASWRLNEYDLQHHIRASRDFSGGQTGREKLIRGERRNNFIYETSQYDLTSMP
jgi:hypothetical protein